LELGGNAACIVDKDVDLENAADRVIFGSFYMSGQSCISVQRIYAHESIYDDFVKKLVSKAKELKKGNPLEQDTFIGPVISQNDAERIESWINEAKENGAKVLVGGKRDGQFIEPTIIENAPKECKVVGEEIFG